VQTAPSGIRIRLEAKKMDVEDTDEGDEPHQETLLKGI
jgi:hypothetical protein